MWYWIKSPDGQENDYNLDELKLAIAERRVQSNWMGRRHNEEEWFPIQHLLQEDDEEHGHAKPPAKYLNLSCGKCGQNLRIQLPLHETTYPCPDCHTAYKASKVSDAPATWVLMPPP